MARTHISICIYANGVISSAGIVAAGAGLILGIKYKNERSKTCAGKASFHSKYLFHPALLHLTPYH